jgi:predicted RNase H-like HicB family nuclease
MECVYPAVFHANGDGSYTITFPDLPGCVSEGKSVGDALHMAQAALAQWIGYLADKGQDIPEASPIAGVAVAACEFANLVRVDAKGGRAVRRTVSIPRWMDKMASESGLSLSKVLQDALSKRVAAEGQPGGWDRAKVGRRKKN